MRRINSVINKKRVRFNKQAEIKIVIFEEIEIRMGEI